MNIYFLTLQCIKNYGSVLQAYATQQLLKKHFDDVTLIRFTREDARDDTMLEQWVSAHHFLSKAIRKMILRPLCNRQIHVFGTFKARYLKQTEQEYFDESDFQKYPIQADAYCAGSDQVWNSSWNQGFFPPMYLSFANDSKMKFAFCSSFGKTELESQEKQKAKKLLDRLSYLSVREQSALNVLESMDIHRGICLLDPTLLLPVEEWKKICAPRMVQDDYLLVYQLNPNKQFDAFAARLAKKKNLKLVYIGLRIKTKMQHGRKHTVFMVPEVEEFLSLIRYASYVVTDSFHGTAFSINFNRQLTVIYPNHFSTRLESILQWAGLQKRHLIDYSDDTAGEQIIDYHSINENLEIERQKGNSFLEEVAANTKI